MSVTHKKWPGINVTDTDREIITRIRDYDGVLQSVDMKDLLMIAAAIAVKQKAPQLISLEPARFNREIMHPTLMAKPDNNVYRQYIALIFYMSEGNQKLDNMSDVSLMVKNFVDYARRGLRILEANYLNKRDGSDELIINLVQQLGKVSAN